EVEARWRSGADELARVLRACDPRQRVAWVAGELSARTLATTRLAETWIHTGDVAAAFGRVLTGPVAFELRGPDGGAWDFVPDWPPLTTIRGDGTELCLVAARRVDPR